MMDMHTHILPCVDDGSKSMEISRELLMLEKKEGVKCVVLTPHQNKNQLNKDELKEKFLEFSSLVSDIGVDLLLGSEVYYYPEMKQDLKDGKILTINDTKYVLIEFSTRVSENIEDILYDISVLGYKPIIAHIERYGYLSLDSYKGIHKYALIQVNAGSFQRKEYKKTLKYLMKNNLIDFIASDCHDLERRTVDFSIAKKILYKKNRNLYSKVFENDFHFE